MQAAAADWVGLARTMRARLHPLLQRAQVKLLDIGPDHPRRMLGSQQRLKVHSAQFNLIAYRFAKPRWSGPSRFDRLVLRQVFKKRLVCHRSLRRSPPRTENHPSPASANKIVLKIHSL
jgi:hypothetical protein